MSSEPKKNPDTTRVDDAIGYFDLRVLGLYTTQPDKYIIEANDFGGHLTLISDYYAQLESEGRKEEYISIRFGYRKLKKGEMAIVVFLPDLFNRSPSQLYLWKPLRLENPEWSQEHDEVFSNWFSVNFEGPWEIEEGPLTRLAESIRIINGLTNELVGLPLFEQEISTGLNFPSAENTHHYQDAHREVYGYLIDGLDKNCITALASKKLGSTIKVGDKKTVEALKNLFPILETTPSFQNAMNLISNQRRLASHKVRPRAKSFPAHSQFLEDLALIHEAARELLGELEKAFNMDGEKAYERSEARKSLPKIAFPPDPSRHILGGTFDKLQAIEGKTIEKVEFGLAKNSEHLHQREVMIIYFTDGSIFGIDTFSNVGNLVSIQKNLEPQDFHVDFWLSLVPPLT